MCYHISALLVLTAVGACCSFHIWSSRVRFTLNQPWNRPPKEQKLLINLKNIWSQAVEIKIDHEQ